MESIYGGTKMNTIAGERGSGKTVKCFERARQQGAVLLCANKRAMREKADAKGYKDIEIMELSDLKDTVRGQKIVVDEALLLLKEWLERAFSVKVDTVSYTRNV